MNDMNRKERHQVEKKLGLTSFYKTMSREKRFEKMYNNIVAGKQMQIETKNRVDAEINKQLDKKTSDTIANNAEYIAYTQKIPIAEAITIAKKEFYQIKKS
jgi:hypothetical protein